MMQFGSHGFERRRDNFGETPSMTTVPHWLR